MIRKRRVKRGENLNLNKAALAQLVEQRFCKAKVLGSSPRGGSDIKFLDDLRVTSIVENTCRRGQCRAIGWIGGGR